MGFGGMGEGGHGCGHGCGWYSAGYGPGIPVPVEDPRASLEARKAFLKAELSRTEALLGEPVGKAPAPRDTGK